MTKDKNNIDKIEGAYDKKFNVVEYLLADSEINKKIDYNALNVGKEDFI